jgi:hypothetical protein
MTDEMYNQTWTTFSDHEDLLYGPLTTEAAHTKRQATQHLSGVGGGFQGLATSGNVEQMSPISYNSYNLSQDVQPTNDRLKLCNCGLDVNIQCDVAKSLKKKKSMAHLNIRSLCRHLEQLRCFFR